MTSCGYLEEKFRECTKKGVDLATSVETLGVDLRTRAKQLGGEREGEEEKVRCDVLAHKKNRVFQKNYMETGVRKLLRLGLILEGVWGGHAVANCANRKAEAEEADGSSSSSSWHKQSRYPCLYSWRLTLFVVEEELSPWPRSFGVEGVWMEK